MHTSQKSWARKEHEDRRASKRSDYLPAEIVQGVRRLPHYYALERQYYFSGDSGNFVKAMLELVGPVPRAPGIKPLESPDLAHDGAGGPT